MRVRLDLEYLSYDDLRLRADEFLRTYAHRAGPPLQIEEIVDLDMGIDIVPVWGLKEEHDIDGFTASDLTQIYVDQVQQERVEHRYRFTLAHEAGHVVLHRGIFEKFHFADLEEYRQFVEGIDEDDRDWLEWQAYCFAGLVLVPGQRLEAAFREELEKPRVRAQIDAAKQRGMSRKSYLGHLCALISQRVARKFAVSARVVEKRVDYDGLHETIP